MTYSPKTENLRPLMLTITLTVISVLCFMLAGYFPNIKWLLQLFFVCLATAAIQIFLKYVLTKFEYTCDDQSLYIYKSMGKRSVLVGKLELINSASYMASEKEFLQSQEDYKVKSVYNYTRNFKTPSVYVYVTTIGETNFMLKLEVNDEFARYVNKKIDESLKGYKKDDEI